MNKKNWMGILGLVVLSASAALAEEGVLDKVKWTMGPATGKLGDLAEIKIPDGYVFAGGSDTRLLMRSMQNPTSGRELGFFAPKSLEWFVVFEFDDSGYVRDDEKDSLDAAAILDSIRKGTEAGNVERRKNGWPEMTIIGWEEKPHYNASTHNLEWTIRAESEGKLVINHNTRVLGRGGVMEVTLCVAPDKLAATMPEFRDALASFDFQPGNRYAEFRAGDKVAEYGLSALVAGGAAAVAVKTGMFKWLWKFLVVGGLAVAAFIKSLFKRKE